MELNRCRWADPASEIYIAYHDQEWGRPEHDDRKLFEMLILEGFQAGLSWLTILMADSGIVRNRRKIQTAVQNAKAFLTIQKEYGSFDRYLWGFTDGQVIVNTDDEVRASSELSDRISADLKRRGMNFVGTVIIYSFLQAVGVVNDHETGCWCYPRGQKD